MLLRDGRYRRPIDHVRRDVLQHLQRDAVIQGNTITNLVGGGWVHAIGLEANTPGVLVTSNTINPLVSPSSDAVAVWFEVNNSYATAKVNQNNFNVTIAAYGIAVQLTIPGTGDFIAQDGSGMGEFQAVLLGTLPLGTPQNVTVEGEVQSGPLERTGAQPSAAPPRWTWATEPCLCRTCLSQLRSRRRGSGWSSKRWGWPPRPVPPGGSLTEQ